MVKLIVAAWGNDASSSGEMSRVWMCWQHRGRLQHRTITRGAGAACAAKRPAVALFAAKANRFKAHRRSADARGAKRPLRRLMRPRMRRAVRRLARPGRLDFSTTKACPIDARPNGS